MPLLNPSFPTFLNTVPNAIVGPRILKASPVLQAVAGNAVAVIDLSADAQQGNMPTVQAVYLDTSNFGYTLTLTHRQTGFPTRVRTNTQGWYAIAATDVLVFDVVAPSGAVGLAVPVWFTNVAMPSAQWQTA